MVLSVVRDSREKGYVWERLALSHKWLRKVCKPRTEGKESARDASIWGKNSPGTEDSNKNNMAKNILLQIFLCTEAS